MGRSVPNYRRLSTVCLFTVLLAACASQPAPPPIAVEMPERWSREAGGTAEDATLSWLESLGGEQLVALVRTSLQHNPDLASAAARIRAAQAQARIAGAPRWPQAGIGVDASRTLRSNSTGFALSSPVNDSRNVGLDLSWEVDLWGRLSRQALGAALDASAVSADHDAARLSLAANVARAWFNGIHAGSQLELARQTAETYAVHRDVIRERARSGIGTVLDLRLIRAQLASAEASLAERRREHDAALRRMDILLGAYPQGARQLPMQLPEPDVLSVMTIPSQMLEQRPDLKAARARAMARQADAAAANRNLLPSFSITASGGRSGAAFHDLFDPDFLVWSIAGALTQPLFSGGRLSGERQFAEAEAERLAHEYASLTLNAFEEVEVALNAEWWLQQREQALAVAREEAEVAEELALQQYARGIIDIITLLDSERRLLDASRELISVRNQRLQNRINLQLALGGPLALTEAVAERTGDKDS